jgi:hypothetical protein
MEVMDTQSKTIGHVLKKASKLDYIVMGGKSVLLYIPFHILRVLQQVLPEYFIETEWVILVRKVQESEDDDDDKKTQGSGADGDYIKLCNMLTMALGVNVTVTETDAPKKTIIKSHDTVLATIMLDDGTFSKSMCIEPDRKHNGIKYASFCDAVAGLKRTLEEHNSLKTIFQLRVLLNGYKSDLVEEPSSALSKSLLDELNLNVRIKSDEISIKTTCKPEPKQSTKPIPRQEFAFPYPRRPPFPNYTALPNYPTFDPLQTTPNVPFAQTPTYNTFEPLQTTPNVPFAQTPTYNTFEPLQTTPNVPFAQTPTYPTFEPLQTNPIAITPAYPTFEPLQTIPNVPFAQTPTYPTFEPLQTTSNVPFVQTPTYPTFEPLQTIPITETPTYPTFDALQTIPNVPFAQTLNYPPFEQTSQRPREGKRTRTRKMPKPRTRTRTCTRTRTRTRTRTQRQTRTRH